jgi:hypothetical protein
MFPPPAIRMVFRILLATLILLGSRTFALEVTRGPYLQTGTPTGITIRWRTDVPVESVVHYGTEANRLHQTEKDLQETTEHVVRLSGLEPDTRYFYSVGRSHETLATGPDYFFVTQPAPGRVKPTRIWVIGDPGTFSTGAGKEVAVRDAYYQYTGSRHTDVWLALGDNAYFSGTDEEYQANFFNVYPSLLRQTVLWSTIGNHETYSPLENDTLPYFNIFSFPTQAEAGGVASGTEKYYSFDYANIHFVCLDSELSDRSLDGPMLQWLNADLEANTRDWVIAYWHSPPYTKGSHDSDNLFDNFGNMTEMRANAVRVLESFGVDLVMCGHSHIYERSFLLHGHYGFSDTLEPTMLRDAGDGRPDGTGAYLKTSSGPNVNRGAVYVVAGSSGWATSRTGVHPVMCFDELQTGSLVIDVQGQRLDAKFLRETGAIDDYFSIIKGAPPEAMRITTFNIKDGQAIVRWKSVPGEKYRVERTTQISPSLWKRVGLPVTATGATSTWSEIVPEGQTQSFYRVVRVTAPPPPPVQASLPSKKRSPSNLAKRDAERGPSAPTRR